MNRRNRINLDTISEKKYVGCVNCGSFKKLAKYRLTFNVYIAGNYIRDDSIALCKECFKQLKEVINKE